MTLSIVGLTSDDRVPGFYGETLYGQGAVSLGALPVFCLVMGNKITAGTATADSDILDTLSKDDADTFFGAGSELARMCYAALDIPGVSLKAAPVLEAGGAAAGTLTITVGGAGTASGQLSVWVCGKLFQTGTASTDTTTTAATALAAALNSDPRMPYTAGSAAAVVTLTTKSKGVRMNDYVVYKDDSKGSGFTLTLGGGGGSVGGGGLKFGNGSGTDSITNVINLLKPAQYNYIAAAEYDSTNAALLRDHVNSEAGPLIGHLEHYVYAQHVSLATTITLAQTTLNAQRGMVVWHLESETAPSEIAAQVASLRSVTEGTTPNPNYDNTVLPSVVPSRVKANVPQHSTLKSALNSGVSPLITTPSATVQIVKLCVTKSLNGSAPDYRTHEVGDAVVPDRIRADLGAIWTGEHVVANPYVGPDPSPDDTRALAQVSTPSNWRARIYQYLKEVAEPQNWIMNVDSNMPLVEYNVASKRLMSAVPTVVRPINHQTGTSVRQQAA